MASAIEAGLGFVRLELRDKLTAGLARLSRRFDAFSSRVLSLGTQAGAAIAAISVPVGLATMKFAEFDVSMRTVQAVSRLAGKSFAELREQAKGLGASTSFSASQVAEAMVSLGRAGFDTGEISSSIAGVLNLARATGTELPEAAGIGADVLRAFGIEAADMSRVVDVLTATANGSSQTLADLFEAMKLLGPTAKDAGVSLEEMSAAVAILANQGIKGSLAGTAIRTAYQRLADPAIAAALRGYGVEAADAAGNIRPLATILDELDTKLKGAGTATRVGAFGEIFGARAANVASALGSSNKSFGDFVKRLNESQGAAQAAADLMGDGLGGAIDRLKSAFESVAIAIAEAGEGALREFADRAAAVAAWIGRVTAANGAVLDIVIRGVAAFAAGTAGLVAFGLAAKLVALGVGTAASAVSLLGAVFGVLLTPIGAAVAAAVALVAIYADLGNAAKSLAGVVRQYGVGAMDRLADAWRVVAAALEEGDLAKAGRAAMIALRIEFEAGTQALKDIWNGAIEDMGLSLEGLQFESSKFLAGLQGGLGDAFDNPNTADATAAAERVLRKNKDFLDALNADQARARAARDREREKERAATDRRIAELRAELMALGVVELGPLGAGGMIGAGVGLAERIAAALEQPAAAAGGGAGVAMGGGPFAEATRLALFLGSEAAGRLARRVGTLGSGTFSGRALERSLVSEARPIEKQTLDVLEEQLRELRGLRDEAAAKFG